LRRRAFLLRWPDRLRSELLDPDRFPMVPDLLCWLGDLLIGGMEELALHIPHLLSHLENQNIKKSSLEKESKT
jgi:hypothetical protein